MLCHDDVYMNLNGSWVNVSSLSCYSFAWTDTDRFCCVMSVAFTSILEMLESESESEVDPTRQSRTVL